MNHTYASNVVELSETEIAAVSGGLVFLAIVVTPQVATAALAIFSTAAVAGYTLTTKLLE